MRIIILFLLFIFITACTPVKDKLLESNKITLKLFKVKNEIDESKTKMVSRKDYGAENSLSKNDNKKHPKVMSWRDIKALYNSSSETIVLTRTRGLRKKVSKISISANEAVLITDLVEKLEFYSEIEFFQYFEKKYNISPTEYKSLAKIKNKKKEVK